MRIAGGNHAGRFAGLAASLVVSLLAAGCGDLTVLPSAADVKNSSFATYKSVEVAYDEIAPGQTRTGDLDQLGFSVTDAANVEQLSYLGIIERFMPRDSIRFDSLDPVVRQCIEARERCSGYAFYPERLHAQRTGSWVLDLFGFQHDVVNYGWSAEIVLLVMDGRVVYKVMSGRPTIEDFHNKFNPLGPFQDLGGTVFGVARSAVHL